MSKLEEWIRQQKAKGYSYTQLEKHLVERGYDKEEVDRLILNVQLSEGSGRNLSGENVSIKSNSRRALLWIIIPIVLIIIGAAVYYSAISLNQKIYNSYSNESINHTVTVLLNAIDNRSNNSSTDIIDNTSGSESNSNPPINPPINSSINSTINTTNTTISVNTSTPIINSTVNTTPVIANVCGDGTIGDDEQCDGINFGGITCKNFTAPNGVRFNGGTLKCNACIIDTSSCRYCGDGVVDTSDGELCEKGVGFVVFRKNGKPYDWLVSSSNPCKNFGYTSGSVSCNYDTCLWDISQCTGRVSAICGNGVLESDEECDYNIMGHTNQTTCQNFNESTTVAYTGGELACTQDCQHDFSDCTTD